ncbi:CPBP family intramembrane metalloprotease [Olivibacter sp. SDN3]|uniref:CPBP family intramembrane glutamic endopeptidase n=1 Tax=Olivibacter sp. SDN3 TaxID=2764720 RepID=UPI001650DF81|nr:type II CAAX endopeptidase family protein [Olivibacter sp. SDN3]QNL48068.1 CPBP family intramembrane metalloprotease [Olivibacter sp. SDN3]
MDDHELRPLWRRFFDLNWKFGLFLILIICIPRFTLVLNANASANYGYIGLVMLISAIAPFVFLSRYGRKAVGITRPKKLLWLFYAFILGLIASIALYFLGEIIYGHSYENWYHYIGRSYNIPEVINSKDKAILFIIMASTGMIFSPIGEELFFRGIVHGSFEKSIGEKRATLVDSTAFALTHIAHFGLVFIDSEWRFLTMPTLLWVLSMFFVSLLFTICKKYSGSLLGAISCHSAFNLGMIYCIFYLI